MQQLVCVQASTVLAAFPRDFACLELGLGGFPHSLLQALFELGFELAPVCDFGSDRNQIGKGG